MAYDRIAFTYILLLLIEDGILVESSISWFEENTVYIYTGRTDPAAFSVKYDNLQPDSPLSLWMPLPHKCTSMTDILQMISDALLQMKTIGILVHVWLTIVPTAPIGYNVSLL